MTKLNSALLRSSDYAPDVGHYGTSVVFSHVACLRFISVIASSPLPLSVLLAAEAGGPRQAQHSALRSVAKKADDTWCTV